MDAVRVAVDVVAGVLPGTPESQYTKRYFITSKEWSDAGTGKYGPTAQAELLTEMNGKAQGWAMYLMLQPDALNWVKTEWIWF